MAQLPRRVAPDLAAKAAAPLLAAAALLLLAAAALLLPGAAAAELDLSGTWHVLVHYRDAATASPEALRWEDRVWELRPSGSRLEWTEYPIVIFDDESGRFERREGTGQYARVLHAWRPGPEQLLNLRAGLATNDRGSQRKRLRRSGDGWRSGARASPTSIGVVTYQEIWSIEDPEGLPVFTQLDVLDSASAEGLEGRTRLRTTDVLEDGGLLVGSYDRDGTRVGTFEMRRSGPRKGVPERKARAQGEASPPRGEGGP